MRLTTFIIAITMLHVSAAGLAQNITIQTKKAKLEDVVLLIGKQSGFDVFYNRTQTQESKPVTLKLRNANLEEALKQCFREQPLTYLIKDGTIIITRKTSYLLDNILEQVVEVFTAMDIRGMVTDEMGNPLPGATIKIKSSGKTLVAGGDGAFLLKDVQKGDLVTVSYLGYKIKDFAVPTDAKKTFLIMMEKVTASLQDVSVVSTGIFSRKKESFTGAVSTFTGTELKAVGNQNIIQSLKSLDPSFIQIENNSAGANPNTLATIELRGRTSVNATLSSTNEFASDPNQPLFILDGFETTLRVITDLDINRVESITLLKDAASASIYGARAANGVVVVETKKPKPGSLQLYYSADFRIEMPDLSGYNMMDAAEKLEYERLSGRYNRPLYDPNALLVLYNQRLAEIKRGVNSYWLSEPLQNGFTQSHSFTAGGGSEGFTYNLTGNYKKTTGIMKGSDRNNWGGTADLLYRKNKLNIRNNLYVNGYTSDDSPYGSFSTWVNANPFFRKTSSDGSINKYLEQGSDQYNLSYSIPNPLYGVHLNKTNTAQNLGIRNNLQAIYSIASSFQLQAGVQVSENNVTTVSYLPPEDSSFDNVDVFKKGTYNNTRNESFQYVANMMMTYGNTFVGGHSLTANLRGEIQQNSLKTIGLVATGFPAGVEGNPAFSYSYQQDSKPLSTSQLLRSNSLLSALNYSYQAKYLVDLSFRLDGSTVFGSTKRYSPFWSSGIGWNINKENFLKEVTWIDMLKVRTSIGMTGNQNFLNTTSATIYSYESTLNRFGLASNVSSLGNSNLEWQNTRTLNAGLDIGLLNNRLSATFNAYQKLTDPLVVDVGVPTSIGSSTVKINTGNLTTKGLEANVRYAIIYKPENRTVLMFGLTVSHFNSVYNHFNSTLNSLNSQQQISGSLIRFQDGYSPYDIWAVKSLGIDPASGKEVFLKKNGQSTFTYDASDIIAVANSNPKIEGVLSPSLRLKAFTFSTYFRYRLGGYSFNTALYNKVENISNTALINYNQDKRALYDRWQTPGDLAQFKAITDLSYTPASSRFVQKDNTLTGESVSLGYELGQYRWIKAAGLKSLRITGYMNDFFYLSTIKRERGTDYPFAYSASFSLNASF